MEGMNFEDLNKVSGGTLYNKGTTHNLSLTFGGDTGMKFKNPGELEEGWKFIQEKTMTSLQMLGKVSEPLFDPEDKQKFIEKIKANYNENTPIKMDINYSVVDDKVKINKLHLY